MKNNKPVLAAPLQQESYTTDKLKNSLAIKTELETPDKFYNMPTSGGSDLAMKILRAGGNVASLPEASKRVSNSQQITVRESGQKRQIISKGNNTETIIEIGDIEKLLGSNKAAKKMFPYLLIKMNEQSFDYKSGNLYRDEVGFSLQELVDIGFYKSIRAARRGFLDAMDIITSLKLKAVVKRGKKSFTTAPVDAEGEGILVMFTGAAVANNYCKAMLNYKINWQPLFQYFTVLPKFAFQLKSRPFDLLYTVFYLARQNSKQIKEKGYFTIGFRTIQQRLELPSEIDNKDPQKTIRQPIEEAVAAIEQQLAAELLCGEPELAIVSVYDDRANIRDYLENGYLRIELKGSYADYFIEQSENRQKQIEKKAKQQQDIADKAKVKVLQKKLEAALDKGLKSGAASE